jgi:hypothetical protein
MLVEQGQHTLYNVKQHTYLIHFTFGKFDIIRYLIYIYTCKRYYVSNWNCVELQNFILEMKIFCQNWNLCFMFMYIDDVLCALFISILVVFGFFLRFLELVCDWGHSIWVRCFSLSLCGSCLCVLW